MIEYWVGLFLAYLCLGLLTCWLARKGWPDELDEALLASVLGPPLMLVLATAWSAQALRARVQLMAQARTRGVTTGD